MQENDSVVQFRGTVYENGSGMVAKKVMRDIELSRDAKALYAYLCSFAWGNTSQERSAFPKVTTQRRELQIKTEKSYYRYRKELLLKGYITIEKSRKSTGKFKSNVYYIEAVPVPKTEEQVKQMLAALNQNAKKDKKKPSEEPQGKKDSVENHTVKKPSMVSTTLGSNHTTLKEGTNKKQYSIKPKVLEEDQPQEEKIEKSVVVDVQSIIMNSFRTEGLADSEIERLILSSIEHGKNLPDCIKQTQQYFLETGEEIEDLMRVLMHGIKIGWSLPKKSASKGKKKGALPKAIAGKVKKPEYTDEELQGTYDDIHATIKFLRGTEKQVLADNH